MKNKTLGMILCFVFSTCMWGPAAGADDAPGGGRLPRVLLLGDSISIGYTPFVQEMLAKEAVVIRPTRNGDRAENCQGTNYGVQHIDRWLKLGDGKWDVIHFNFGLHDLKRVDPKTGANSNNPAHPRQAPPERYEAQLRQIVDELRETGAALIFATTTPVPAGGVMPHRDVEDPQRYNAIARRIMREHKIAVDDLYAFAKPRLAEIQRPVNVHFTPEGSRLLAGEVVRHIRRTLAARAGGVSAHAASKPNIVFIMVDDMGWADLGCFGGTAIETPHLDRMAAEGIRFTQAYSGCTVCAPARCVLMTGQHMGRASVRGNTGGIPLLDQDVTVAEVLKRVGYATGGFGKWGLGDLDTQGVPERQGFDTFFGYYHQVHAHYYYPDYLIDTGSKAPLPGNAGFYDKKPGVGFFAARDVSSGIRRQFSHELIFERMLRFIRDHRDGPFFCYAPWTPPHGRYEMPDDDPAVKLYADKSWSAKAKVVAAMDTMIDRQVGQVFDLLEELGIDDKTIVFFCSDHGAADRMEGELDSCGPLRGFKRSMYEGGLRTPLIAHWPGKIAAGTESDHVCYFGDFMATFAQLAGAGEYVPGGVHSVSIVPTLLGESMAQQRHEFLYWEWPRYDWGKQVYTGLMQAVRVDDWKLLRHNNDRPWELYDLSSDEGETHDVAALHADVVAGLAEIAKTASVEPRPQREPAKPRGARYR